MRSSIEIAYRLISILALPAKSQLLSVPSEAIEEPVEHDARLQSPLICCAYAMPMIRTHYHRSYTEYRLRGQVYVDGYNAARRRWQPFRHEI